MPPRPRSLLLRFGLGVVRALRSHYLAANLRQGIAWHYAFNQAKPVARNRPYRRLGPHGYLQAKQRFDAVENAVQLGHIVGIEINTRGTAQRRIDQAAPM